MTDPSRMLEAPTGELPVTLTLTEVANVLNLRFTRGEKKGRPNRRLALDLVADGRLSVIDPTLPSVHWAVSRDELTRYIARRQRLALVDVAS